MTSKKGDCFMQILEVGIRKLQLYFQEMAHGVRYLFQVNIKYSSTQVKILVDQFKSHVVIILKPATGF